MAKAIRFCERMRRPKGVSKAKWRAACTVNHACIVIEGGADAVVSEEEGHGDVLAPLADFDDVWYAVVSIEFGPIFRDEVVRFADAAVGSGYGFVSIFADLVNALTGLELSLSTGSRMVCSTRPPAHWSEAG